MWKKCYLKKEHMTLLYHIAARTSAALPLLDTALSSSDITNRGLSTIH